MKKSDVKKLLRKQKVVKLKPEKPILQLDMNEIKKATNSEYEILRDLHVQLGNHVHERVDLLEDDVKRAFKSAAIEQHEAIQKEFLTVKKLNEQLHIFVEEQIDVASKEMRKEFQQQLAEIEANLKMELQTVKEALDTQIKDLKNDTRQTFTTMEKNITSLDRKIDRNAQAIQKQVKKINEPKKEKPKTRSTTQLEEKPQTQEDTK